MDLVRLLFLRFVAQFVALAAIYACDEPRFAEVSS